MPCVLIEVRKRYTRKDEMALMDAVHAALCEVFKILPDDRNIRFIAHLPHRFACPPILSAPEAYTLISIDAFAGRSLDAKRRLYQAMVARLEALGIPRDHVKILLRELPRENWGIRGGQAACDVDLGYTLEV